MSWCAYPSRIRVPDEEYHKTGKFSDLHHTDIPFLKELGCGGCEGDNPEPYISSTLKFAMLELSRVHPEPEDQWLSPSDLAAVARDFGGVIRYMGEHNLDRVGRAEIVQMRDFCIALANRGIGLMVSY